MSPRMRFWGLLEIDENPNKGVERRTQLATIGKCLSTVFALVWLFSSMTTLMAVQGCLSSKILSTDRAPEIFV